MRRFAEIHETYGSQQTVIRMIDIDEISIGRKLRIFNNLLDALEWE